MLAIVGSVALISFVIITISMYYFKSNMEIAKYNYCRELKINCDSIRE